MKNSNFKVLVMPAIILFAVCLVSTFLLAYTNKITEPKIDALAVENAQAARKDLLADAKSFEPATVAVNGESFEYFLGLDAGGKTAGYVFTTVSTGYGGDIKVMTGVDENGAVKKINILELSETPGLGMNATDDSFINLFTGKSGVISVVKTKAGENQIQAMTGATITSKAVTAAVNEALKLFEAVTSPAETTAPSTPQDDAETVQAKLLLPGAESFGEKLPATLNGTGYDYKTGLDKDGKIVGYIFVTGATTVHQGTLTIATGIDANGVVTGVKPLVLDVTPGYETEVKSESFLRQYIGKSGSISGANDVQAVTGATECSDAVTAAVNIALDLYNSVSGGNQ